MSLLDRYKEERPLGKGAFGEVVLVKNKNDELFAIKKLNKKMLKDDSPFLEYLYGEIACMEELKVCPLVVRLEEKEITNDYIYLLLEYCNGGDLASLQSKQPGMVFKLNDAIEILVNVIRGLEDIHQHGYLHRDIKPGNVLVKENNGKTIFKIADFGFSKKIHEVNKTACGTEPFMAPEIFLKEDYDFPVDMWAFGILLYYMLNKEYPFRLNEHYDFQSKYKELMKQVNGFSYTESVQKTKKKKMENCIPEVEDLFKRIFIGNPRQRISFLQIRQHPLFKNHFKNTSDQSVRLYKEGFSKVSPSSLLMIESFPFRVPPFGNRIEGEFKYEQKNLLNWKDTLDFLQNCMVMIAESNTLDDCQRYSFAWCLCVYYDLLCRELLPKRNLTPEQATQKLSAKFKKGKWAAFVLTPEWKSFVNITQGDFQKVQQLRESYQLRVKILLEEINAINKLFKETYHLDRNNKLDDAFLDCYETTASKCYEKLIALAKEYPERNSLVFGSVMVAILLSYQALLDKGEDIKLKVFTEYTEEVNVRYFGYCDVMRWFRRRTNFTAAYNTIELIKEYTSQ